MTVTNDQIYENDEEFTLTLGAPTNADLGTPNPCTVTITDNDNVPTLTVAAASAPEGNNGNFPFVTFTLQLSNPTSFAVTLNYTTVQGTAKSGRDFTPVNAADSFPAESTTLEVQVPIMGDDGFEKDETFTLEVSNVDNANTNTPTISATGTITNDDSRPLRPVVRMILEGNLGQFDEDQFMSSIAAVLGIDASRVQIRSKAAGSVIVVFAIEGIEGNYSIISIIIIIL